MSTRQIAIRDLVPDSVLDFDLVSPSGAIILPKGQRLERAVIDQWLALGFEKVLGSTPLPIARPLDHEVIEETAACTKAIVQRLGELVGTIAAGVPSSMADLAPVLAMIVQVTLSDRDAALWSVEKDCQLAETPDQQLAKRSAKFSLMSYGTAMAHGLSPENCESIAVAAQLHDFALYTLSMDNIKKSHRSGITTQQILRQHSLLGAELVSSFHGISELTRQAMVEVHEQVDGSGYPRGLRSERLSIGGRVLNLVDAYLSLTDSGSHTGLIPADAIAYLMKQTSLGAFDIQCMQSFLKVVSAYGIGTAVTLDDNSSGEVIRSTESDPLRPIIRLDNEQKSVIDLRHSRLAIKEARLAQADSRKRIKRSEMDHVLWRPAYLTD